MKLQNWNNLKIRSSALKLTSLTWMTSSDEITLREIKKREDEKSFCCPQLANNMLVLLWGETSPWWGWAGLDLVQWKHRAHPTVNPDVPPQLLEVEEQTVRHTHTEKTQDSLVHSQPPYLTTSLYALIVCCTSWHLMYTLTVFPTWLQYSCSRIVSYPTYLCCIQGMG